MPSPRARAAQGAGTAIAMVACTATVTVRCRVYPPPPLSTHLVYARGGADAQDVHAHVMVASPLCWTLGCGFAAFGQLVAAAPPHLLDP